MDLIPAPLVLVQALVLAGLLRLSARAPRLVELLAPVLVWLVPVWELVLLLLALVRPMFLVELVSKVRALQQAMGKGTIALGLSLALPR